MALDLTSLRKVVISLEKALTVGSVERLATMPEDHQEVIKAGVIQNFEIAYEVCWKFMRRWLSENMGPTTVDGVTRRELFRASAESKLITDVDQWMEYHEARNETSHTYDQDTADDVYRVAQTFYLDARKLLEVLEKKND